MGKLATRLTGMKVACEKVLLSVESSWSRLKRLKQNVSKIKVRKVYKALDKAGGQMVESDFQKPEIDRLIAEAKKLYKRIDSVLTIS